MPKHVQVSPEEDLAAFYGDDPSRGPAPPLSPPGEAPRTVPATPPAPPASAAAASVVPGEAPPSSAPGFGYVPPPVPGTGSPASLPPSKASRTIVPDMEWAAEAEPSPDSTGPRVAPVPRPPPPPGGYPPPIPGPIVQGSPSPAMALVLSLLVPGAGQMYAGQMNKGIVILVVAVLTGCLGCVLNAVAGADAYVIAQRRLRGEAVDEWKFF